MAEIKEPAPGEGRAPTSRELTSGLAAVVAFAILLTVLGVWFVFTFLLRTCCTAPSPALSDSAPPAVVLDAYLQALQTGDCATGRQFALQSFAKGNGELCGDLRVSASRFGDPATPSGTEVVFATTLTTEGSRDGSVPAGDVIWFYTLDRQPSGAWRITGGGSGP